MIPFFLHIPKTAGSTIRTLITRNYSQDEVMSLEGRDILRQARSSVGQTDKLRLVQGHIPHGLHWIFGLRAADYFVFLRHPVARHFSEVAHARRDPEHGYHQVVTNCDSPIDWAGIGDKAVYFRNTSCQYLSGVWFTGDLGCVEYQQAVRNLLECRFVGLAERFDESILMMARQLKWRHVVYERHNVTRAQDKVEPTEAMVDACAKWLQFDLSLYDIACERFEEDVRQHGTHLQEAAAQLSELSEQQASLHPEIKHHFYHVGEPLPVAEQLEQQVAPGSPLWLWIKGL